MTDTAKAPAGLPRFEIPPRPRPPGPSVGTRDIQPVKEQRKEGILRNQKDLDELKNATRSLREEDEMSLLGMEAVVAIINFSVRKQILRSRVMGRMSDEKELSSTLNQHREEFSQFIWKRRVASRKEMRMLFQAGPGMICRFGDMIGDSTLEGLQAFEKNNWARLSRDGIRWDLVDGDDLGMYFMRKVFLIAPKHRTRLRVTTSRLEVHLRDIERNLDLFAEPTPATIEPPPALWLIALGFNVGPGGEEGGTVDWKLALDVVDQLRKRVGKEMRCYFEVTVPDGIRWRVGFGLAKYLKEDVDETYPGEKEYSFGFGHDGCVYWNGKKRTYIGPLSDPLAFLGVRTFGFLVDLYEGTLRMVVDGKVGPVGFGKGGEMWRDSQQEQQKTWISTMHLIPMFALSDQEATSTSAYMEKPQIRVNFGDTPFAHQVEAVACNDAMQFAKAGPGLDMISIIDQAEGGMKVNEEEEEKLHMAMEKNMFRVSLLPEPLKSFSQFPPSIYRRSLACTKIQRVWRRHRGRVLRAKIMEAQYRAATLIQIMARKKLKKIRHLKNEAAFKIQRNWRRKKFIWLALLRCIYQQPIPELHRAATIVQRKWRHWAMFRNSPIASKYNARIEDLNRAVNTIIHWWRPLHQKMSEIKRLREVGNGLPNDGMKIIDTFTIHQRHAAATNIQRVYRGYYLRQLLRPDLRAKLRELGESVARHRQELLRVRGAYVLQNAWRSYQIKRVRADKLRTRNRAAARIQAMWKGYWVRSRKLPYQLLPLSTLNRWLIDQIPIPNIADIHLRFTYGEAVFLSAVCKALRACHFILKMYRPCGIVCPPRSRQTGDSDKR
ncbi:hypothetical protein HDV00_000460 [Rhizophlyctis rosea]|nr:hypothetical protein HDV00_000460 [Rhizophlyctis rosea]